MLTIQCVDTQIQSFALEHNDVDLQQPDTYGGPFFIYKITSISLLLFMPIESVTPNIGSSFVPIDCIQRCLHNE